MPKRTRKPKREAKEAHKTSIYIPLKNYEAIRDIAYKSNKRVHDLILDGLDHVLIRHGKRPIDRRLGGGWKS